MKDILYGIINNATKEKHLEDLPELRMKADERKEVEKIIHNIYLEFQAFMEVPNMPDYNLYLKPQQGLEVASTKYVKGEGHNLYISDTLLKEQNMKERLFHEFTHIYDSEYLDKNYAYRKYSDNDCRKIHVHTEIHAEQIRFLYMLGCKTITDVPKNIDYNTVVYDLDGKETTFYECLYEFKSKMIENYVIQAKKVRNNTISISAIDDIVSKVSYYIGALTVYQKYCSYKLDEVMDLSIISAFWNIDIERIIDFYCKHDIHKPTIKTVPKIEIAHMGDILMYELINEARKNYIILGDAKGRK